MELMAPHSGRKKHVAEESWQKQQFSHMDVDEKISPRNTLI